MTGDVTAYVLLWAAGTEGDETPGEGANQAPRQSGPNTGPSEGGVVQLVTQAQYEDAANELRLTITPLP